jgi:nicotinamidase-related amidase
MAAFPHAPLTERTVHLCIDMQRLFSAEGIWPTPWMMRVLPAIEAIAERHASRTLFTRFVPPTSSEPIGGGWQHFYAHWPHALRDRLPSTMLDLMPSLGRLVPPAEIVDRPTYSAFACGALREMLGARRADGLVVTGAETDVCVLSTVMAAVDWGFPVLVVTDAVCSSSDEGHDALMRIFGHRLGHQIAAATAEEVLRSWTV